MHTLRHTVSFYTTIDYGDGTSGWYNDISFTVTIANYAPTFISSPVYSTYVGVASLYLLPTITDFEGHKVSISVGASASFIIYNTASKGFDISPSIQS